MTQISILGCGWLGLPLAKTLIQNGFSIKGATTSSEKLPVLEQSGIQPYLIVLTPEELMEDESRKVANFLENSKTLIIDIPPKLRGLEKDSSSRMSFVAKIKNLIPFIEKSTIENLIFVSSTSVYGNSSSFDCARDNRFCVTEETVANPETESGRQLLETEQLLQKNPNFQTTILRFGGLVGEDRNPIQFLAGKTNLENPNSPINLIHQDDCIGIILKIIEQDFWNEILHAVSPFHPSRAEYYTQKAMDMNWTIPQFNTEKSNSGKTISSAKIENQLGYVFRKPSL